MVGRKRNALVLDQDTDSADGASHASASANAQRVIRPAKRFAPASRSKQAQSSKAAPSRAERNRSSAKRHRQLVDEQLMRLQGAQRLLQQLAAAAPPELAASVAAWLGTGSEQADRCIQKSVDRHMKALREEDREDFAVAALGRQETTNDCSPCAFSASGDAPERL
jgi:hypothetical protein